jgi:phosphorylase kinase alpha/beta subunit
LGKSGDLEKQILHFNRSLRQLTDAESGFREYLCPELYYRKGKRYVPNDVTPLLWTQANLMLALHFMKESAQLKADK